jgi:hypothetical protein
MTPIRQGLAALALAVVMSGTTACAGGRVHPDWNPRVYRGGELHSPAKGKKAKAHKPAKKGGQDKGKKKGHGKRRGNH